MHAAAINSNTLWSGVNTYFGTNGSSLGATAHSGTITITANGNAAYMGIS